MKKIIALLCALIMLTACCITANATTLKTLTPDEEIAKENGYTIEYYLKDGWKVPVRYLDIPNRIVPNEIVLIANKELDFSDYVEGEAKDFYGVEILKVEAFIDTLSGDMLDLWLKKNPNRYDYVLTTAKFFTAEEAAELFKGLDFVTTVNINEIGVECIVGDTEEVACDVNFDNVFDTMDYITVKRAYFGTYNEADMYCNKGDLNNNLEIDAVDSALMKRAYFDLFNVEQ